MGSPVRPLPPLDDALAALRQSSRGAGAAPPPVAAESTAARPAVRSAPSTLVREMPGGAAGAAIEGVANGAMLGGGAYAGGLLDTLLQGSSYAGHFRDNLNRNIAQERSNLSGYQNAHPVATAVGELAGGALPAIAAEPLSIGSAAAKYGKLARLGGSVADGMLAGAASGAVSANPGQIAQGVKRGAAVGGVLGAAVPAVASAVGAVPKTVRAIAGAGSADRALGKLAQITAQAKLTPEAIAKAGADAKAAGAPAILGDLLGTPGRRAVQWAVGQPSGEGAALLSKLEDRMGGQYDRVLGRVQDAVGQPFQNMPQTSDALLHQRRANAQPLYDAAYAKGPVMTPTLEKALSDPDFQKAIAKGKSLAAKRALTRETPITPAEAGPASSGPTILGHTPDGQPITAADIATDASGAPRWIGTKTGSARLLKSTADAEDRMRATVREIAERHGFTGAWDMSQLSPEETRALHETQAAYDAAAAANRAVRSGGSKQPATLTFIDQPAQPGEVVTPAPSSGPMTDQEALYAKLLHLNGGNAEAANAAMRQLGSRVPESAAAAAPKAPEPVPIEVLDYAKRYLDNGIRRGFDAQSTFDHTTATATNGLLSKVLDEVDAQVPEYAKARQVYHSDSRMLDALEIGRQAMTMHPDELAAVTAGMSDPEKEMVRAGFMDAFKQKAGSVADRNDLSKRFLTDPNMRDRFRAVAPSAMDALTQLRDQETGLARTLDFAKGGSNTVDKAMFAQAMNDGVRPSDLAVMPLSPHRTLIRVAGRLGQGIQLRSNARLADELAPMLAAEPGTPGFASVVDRLMHYGDPTAQAVATAGRRALVARALAVRAGETRQAP